MTQKVALLTISLLGKKAQTIRSCDGSNVVTSETNCCVIRAHLDIVRPTDVSISPSHLCEFPLPNILQRVVNRYFADRIGLIEIPLVVSVVHRKGFVAFTQISNHRSSTAVKVAFG